jgi:cyclase
MTTFTRPNVLGGLIAAGAVCVAVAAQQPPQRAVLPGLEKVKDNLYIIAASSPVDRSKFTGGNTGVFITDNGVVVVDTKLAGYGPDILAKIKAVTDKPVTTIINTHTHGDHTGSNEGFPASVEIVAHENTKANMMKMDAFKGDKAQFLPKKTYKDKLTLGTGKNRVDLYYFGAGHTNGDTFVVFPALKVVHAGDMFAGKGPPLIDTKNGGSGVAYPATLAKAASSIKNVDTVITGHSPLMTFADLKEFADFNKDFLTWAKAELKGDKTAEQAAAEYKLPEKYKGYTMPQRPDRLKSNVQAIYDELNKK